MLPRTLSTPLVQGRLDPEKKALLGGNHKKTRKLFSFFFEEFYTPVLYLCCFIMPTPTISQICSLSFLNSVYINPHMHKCVYTEIQYIYMQMHIHIYNRTFIVHQIRLKSCSIWGNSCKSSQQSVASEIMNLRGENANAGFGS